MKYSRKRKLVSDISVDLIKREEKHAQYCLGTKRENQKNVLEKAD